MHRYLGQQHYHEDAEKDIADPKPGHLHVDKFGKVLNEFPEAFCLCQVCWKIKGTLFPYKNGLFVGTPPGPPDMLHKPIIRAFDNALAGMIAGEESE
jgi:hypothetical protein